MGIVGDMKKGYDYKISQLEEKLKEDFEGRLSKVENKYQKINENLISLVTFSDKVVNN